MTTIQANQNRVHKSKHASTVKKKLSEEDKARLQAIDDAMTNGFRKTFQISQVEVLWEQLHPIFSQELSGSSIKTPQQNNEFNTYKQEEFQRGIQIDRPRRRQYNFHKYKEVPLETAQKFIIDTIWRCVDSRKKKEDFIFNSNNYVKLWALITQEKEKDIEVVMEEPLLRYNSCTSKKYKKKEIVRIDDVHIKNVSISNFDNVL
ncbi:MAG: hypothetical protein EZS28_000957 [Streblomastix strix]|uniref:Uncharacterized protein n=1 Tax=Streblomastix strix TaxID=222440 RepID=A0A5J4X8E0_9EUKA|nr:MAG: hypothetical protein EZS28_000957 [Streblomastix strix]